MVLWWNRKIYVITAQESVKNVKKLKSFTHNEHERGKVSGVYTLDRFEKYAEKLDDEANPPNKQSDHSRGQHMQARSELLQRTHY